MSGTRILFVEHHGQIVGGGQLSLLALMRHLECYEPHCVTGGGGSMTEAVAGRFPGEGAPPGGIPFRITGDLWIGSLFPDSEIIIQFIQFDENNNVGGYSEKLQG